MATIVKTITVLPSLSALNANVVVSFVSFSVSSIDRLVALVDPVISLVNVAVSPASFTDCFSDSPSCLVRSTIVSDMLRDFFDSITLLCLNFKSTRKLIYND